MKINEEMYEEDGKIIVKKTHDYNPVLKQMEQIREAGITSMGGDKSAFPESRFIGRIPLSMINEWLKEAGVAWDDAQARSDVIKKNILSGNFDKLRSDWKGNY